MRWTLGFDAGVVALVAALAVNCSEDGVGRGFEDDGGGAMSSAGGGAGQSGNATAAGAVHDGGDAGAQGGEPVAGAAAGGDAGGQGGTTVMVPASPALPCGAECDALGYSCVSDACRAPEGAQLWQHRLNERYIDYAGDIASDSAGNAVVGFTTETREPFLGNRLYLRKYDVDGGLIWEHAILEGQYGLFDAIALDPQDRVYVGGRLGKGVTSAFVQMLDDQGELLHQVDFDTEDLAFIEDLALDPDGNLILVGSNRLRPTRPVIMKKLDPTGSELWSRTYHDGSIHYAGFHVGTTATGQILLATSLATTPISAFIGQYDGEGNELWSDTYATAATTVSSGIAVATGGEVLVSGFVQDQSSWLRRYSAAGQLLTPSVLHDDGRALTALAARAGTFFVGGNQWTPGHPLQAWISRTAADGVLGWQLADALDAFSYGRAVEHLAITPQGDVLALGSFTPPTSVWLARFAGPQGGMPRIDAQSEEHVLTNTYPDHDGSAVFVDPDVPDCDASGHYRLTGTLGADPIEYSGSSTSNLLATSHEMLTSMMLRWEGYVREGATMTLSGGYWVVPAGHPDAGQTLCLSGGDVGILPPTYTPDGGRELKYRITAASLGADCTGPSVDVDIKGCFYRFSDYLP
ncbi:MAG TPA: hypothetical protein VJN18_31000 [Polyangiaceae bacterium]|nr:hypothetical protein [Polyangiaceae bacterium]